MHKNRLAALSIALAAAVLLSGCGRRTMVSVNGEKITRAEFQRRLERLAVPTGPQSPPQQAGALVMNQLVNEMLILQLAKEKGVAPTEADVDRKLALIKKEGNLNDILRSRAIAIEDFKHELLVNQALTNIMTKGIKVSDNEVRAQYERLLKAENSPFKRPEQVQLSLIMCTTKAKIDKAASLLKGGTAFSSVAMQLSEDPGTRQQGGAAGWLSRPERRPIPKIIVDTAFSLKPNTVSEPFQAPYAGSRPWFILKVGQHRDARVQSYNDVKDILREQIALAKAQRQTDFGKMLEDYRKKSKITVKVQRYKDIVRTGETEKKEKKAKKE